MRIKLLVVFLLTFLYAEGRDDFDDMKNFEEWRCRNPPTGCHSVHGQPTTDEKAPFSSGMDERQRARALVAKEELLLKDMSAPFRQNFHSFPRPHPNLPYSPDLVFIFALNPPFRDLLKFPVQTRSSSFSSYIHQLLILVSNHEMQYVGWQGGVTEPRGSCDDGTVHDKS
uniref:Uncharacterized protein n=1 Tax=Angiostrongylus cantonensis TaxID=6313 RepID=A0A0K0D0G2_ANGCA